MAVDEYISIPIGAPPWSPWIRIALVQRTPEKYAVDYGKLRTIDDFEIILQLEGHTWTWLEPYGSVDVAPGDLIFNPPGIEHAWAYTAGAHAAIHFDFCANPALVPMLNLHPTERIVQRQPLESVPIFELTFDGADSSESIKVPFVVPARNPGLWRDRMDRVIEVWQRDARPSTGFQLLAAETVGWMMRTLSEDAAHAGLTESSMHDPRILAVLKEIDAHELTPEKQWLSVPEMARLAGLGQTAFYALFRQVTGRSPRQYLEERRIARAEQLLIETNRTVVDIAHSQGYDDAYHFSSAFKRVTGVAPTTYRTRSLIR